MLASGLAFFFMLVSACADVTLLQDTMVVLVHAVCVLFSFVFSSVFLSSVLFSWNFARLHSATCAHGDFQKIATL